MFFNSMTGPCNLAWFVQDVTELLLAEGVSKEKILLNFWNLRSDRMVQVRESSLPEKDRLASSCSWECEESYPNNVYSRPNDEQFSNLSLHSEARGSLPPSVGWQWRWSFRVAAACERMVKKASCAEGHSFEGRAGYRMFCCSKSCWLLDSDRGLWCWTLVQWGFLWCVRLFWRLFWFVL